MIKYFKKIANMTCVKEGGWRHFVAHVIGSHSVAHCAMLSGRNWTKGFIEGINSVKK